MPSDSGAPTGTATSPPLDAVARSIEALRPRIEAFRSAVSAAEEEVRSYVTQRRGASEFKGEKALMELGPFAVGRIDPERFAALIDQAEELPGDIAAVLDRADAILTGFVESKDVYSVVVEPGGDLRDTVKGALGYMGMVFGASRAVELARAGIYDAAEHNHLLAPLSFRFWNRAERGLAPPVVVEVNGEDCLPAGLGEFLDGSVCIVLATSGPTTAAPLARLITPGTFVMQTAEAADLERMAASPHPGVAILFDEARPEQARFVHDPDAGPETWDRLQIDHMPEHSTVGRGHRAPSWVEEVEHLRALARRPNAPAGTAGVGAVGPQTAAIESAAGPDDATSTATTPGAAPESGTQADQLAAWLLAQTDLG